MAIDIQKDGTTGPALTQAQLDALYPNRAGTSLWKLSAPGRILVEGTHELMGPQLAADGSVLAASQTVYHVAGFPNRYPSGVVIAGP